jgi:hypothetical protein
MGLMAEQMCNFCWGSHGCSLPVGHEGVHRCLVGYWDEDSETLTENVSCCEYDEQRPATARVRHNYGEDNEPEQWGEWGPYGDGWHL